MEIRPYESQCFCVFGVKNIYSGLLAQPEVIVTISNRESSLEDKMNIVRIQYADL